MKILSISHYYPPHIGGLEIVATKLAGSLRDAGNDVSIITFRTGKSSPGRSNENGIMVHRVRGLNFFDTYFGIPFPIGGLGLMYQTWREVKAADAVQLHDVFYQSSWVAYFFARWYGKPILLIQHVGLVTHSSRLVMGIQCAVYSTIGRRIFAYAKNIIVYNKNVRSFLIAEGVSENKILELRNGIDVSAFHPIDQTLRREKRRGLGLPEDAMLGLFVGRFVPKKGFNIVYDARDSKYDLVFVGSGIFPKEYTNTRGIHPLGPKTQSELAEIYSLVDFFVFPSKGEMFTLVMQEAMAAGLPIITTDEPGYRDYELNRNLISFVEPNAQALRVAMTELVLNPSLREKMGVYSRTLAEERFNWNNNVAPIIDLFARIAPENKKVIVTTSWDDGHVLDFRLAELMKKYGVRGTFYISPFDHELPLEKRLTENQIREIGADFEIGAHTMTHRPLPTISLAEATKEIIDSKKYLEEVIGAPVLSFCYPRGEYTAQHAVAVKDAGYKLARTVSRFSYDLGTNPFEMPTTIHTYDHFLDIWGVIKLANFNPFRFIGLYRNWEKQAIVQFNHVMQNGGVFHLWGHSWEVDNHQDWNRLEYVFAHIGNREGVEYVPNKELL